MKRPTKFCIFPSMGYWEIDGEPVSSREAQYGSHPRAEWKESEVSKELHLHLGH